MNLPEFVTPLKDDEKFFFECHPGVTCFTNCCHELELSLTPYDVLRLRKATGLHSAKFLDRYVIIEPSEESAFPAYYLTMVDDGKASCVFLNKEGCSVYNHRPGACRTYPMGRAAIRRADGSIFSQFVLLKEKHCKGFLEKIEWTAVKYTVNQQLDSYNKYNDLVAEILQHKQIKNGKKLDKTELSDFNLALYDLDTFKEKLLQGELEGCKKLNEDEKSILDNEETLFKFAVQWLIERLYGSTSNG